MTGTWNRRRKIQPRPIYLALGDLNTQPPTLHSFSGADTVACKGNLSFWKAFKDCDIGIKQVFADLGKQAVLEYHIERQFELYVCLLYQPDTTLVTVNGLRWWIFPLKQEEAERLPPIKTALIQAIKRTHFQRIVWYNGTVANLNIPSPSEYGCREEAEGFFPVMTTMDPAPEVILQLVKCDCTSKTKYTTLRCKCKSNKLFCTDLCTCGTKDESCNKLMLDDKSIDEDSITDGM